MAGLNPRARSRLSLRSGASDGTHPLIIHRSHRILAALAVLGLWAAGIGPGRGAPAASPSDSFQTGAPFAFLIDAETGTVLFDKNGDGLMAPASTAKIMTAEIVFHEIKAGRLKLDDMFVVSENAWRTAGVVRRLVDVRGAQQPHPGRGPDPRPRDPVGHDAAIALAEGISGSEDNFANLMNGRAAEIGMTRSHFTNPWGRGDPAQKVTPRDMALLAAAVIHTYPEFYRYFGEREFTWNKIRQLTATRC